MLVDASLTTWYNLFLNKKFFSNWKRLSFRRVWLSNIIIQCSDSLTETNVYFTTYYGTTFKLQYLHNAQGTVFTPLSFQSVLVVQKKQKKNEQNQTNKKLPTQHRITFEVWRTMEVVTCIQRPKFKKFMKSTHVYLLHNPIWF